MRDLILYNYARGVAVAELTGVCSTSQLEVKGARDTEHSWLLPLRCQEYLRGLESTEVGCASLLPDNIILL